MSQNAQDSVRPATNQHEFDAKKLAQGIDSLDLSLYVEWDTNWSRLSEALQQGKTQAAGTDGIRVGNGSCLILPSGKRPNFRWHLQWPQFHLFIGKSQTPQRSTPNVFASINSQPLWRHGVKGATQLVVNAVEALGGSVVRNKVNRCDPAVDWLIPGGLSLEFLRELRVPRHLKNSDVMSGDDLETFYVGAKDSPIQLRIYDKAKEVATNGDKLWFLDVWGVKDCRDVWRVEFQVRRTALKELWVEKVEGLEHLLGRVWDYLTKEWFSLRCLDNPNPTRRTVHPWWQAVQEARAEFGPSGPALKRVKAEPTADVSRSVATMAGYLLGIAARRGKSTLEEALSDCEQLLREHWQSRNFEERYRIKAIQLGRSPQADHPPDGTEALAA